MRTRDVPLRSLLYAKRRLEGRRRRDMETQPGTITEVEVPEPPEPDDGDDESSDDKE
jgi:hypothetical protein